MLTGYSRLSLAQWLLLWPYLHCLALTSISCSDLGSFVRYYGRVFKDFSTQRLVFYKKPFVHDDFFLGSVLRGDILSRMVVFSCAFLFCFAKPTFFRDAWLLIGVYLSLYLYNLSYGVFARNWLCSLRTFSQKSLFWVILRPRLLWILS